MEGQGGEPIKHYMKREARARFPDRRKFEKEFSGVLIGLAIGVMFILLQ